MPITVETQTCAQGEAVQFVFTILAAPPNPDNDPTTDDISAMAFQVSIIRDNAMQEPEVIKAGVDLVVDNTAKTVTASLSSEETYAMLGLYDFDLFRIDAGSEAQHTRGKLEVLLAATKFEE